MKCPKCKTEVTLKDTFCPDCGLRLVIECPKCKGKVRLGSVSCRKCGYVFVKFCPKCNSANYVSSPTCRKCFYVFEENKTEENKAEKKVEKNQPLKKDSKEEEKKRPKGLFMGDGRLEFFIDFINLPSLFKKYNNEEFKNKVILNIKTSIKVAFGSTAEFYRENIARFKVNYNKNNGIAGKIEKFNLEMEKFNGFLNETLSSSISHKFVILVSGEFSKDKPIMQLAIGGDKDIITSKSAYELLCEEISLVKVSPDSYKKTNLETTQKEINEYQESDEGVVLEMVAKAILDNNNIKAISINAPRGAGKSHILSLLYKKLEKTEIAILPSRCSALSQVAPLGLFQDAFLNLFNLPFAPENYEETIQSVQQLIGRYLPENFDVKKIETLMNLMYPVKEDYFEALAKNKERTFSDIKDVLCALRQNSRLLFVIDDFDLIDEMSFEFLNYLVKSDFFTEGSKFVLCYRNQSSINMYIPREILGKENCLDISLQKRELASCRVFIKKFLGEVSVLPRKISDQIIINAKGDLAYAGQVLYHLIETKMIYSGENGKFTFSKKYEDYLVPQSISDIMEQRLDFLKNESKMGYLVLTLASFLGGKFTNSVIQGVIKTDSDTYNETLVYLEENGYITKITEDSFVFKNSLVWTNVYIKARSDEEIKPFIEALLKVLLERVISSPAVCALLAQTLGNKQLALALWTKNIKLASAVGDSALYIMSQKQSLVALEGLNIKEESLVSNNIYERVGKLTYKKTPMQAIEYISNAIVDAKMQGNNEKVIELSGYLAKSSMLAQKYPAVIETIDNLVLLFPDVQKFQIYKALIKTRKLEALLAVGNFEEISNLMNTEINPQLSEFLKQKKKLPFILKEEVYIAWLKSNIIHIESLAYQGNPVSFELTECVEKELLKNPKEEFSELRKMFKLASALSYTMKGFVNDSDEILHSAIKDFSQSKNDSFLISKWNMITIFNKILRLEFENIKEDLFEAVTYANNIGDNFVKNILKAVLAYVILEEGDSLRAIEICQEQMSYFSNEKIALGALISWYISARATLKISGADKAIEICEKSIQITENPKINSSWFRILFRLLMIKAYLIKDDIESAKMYIELANEEVNHNEINYFMVLIARMRAIILQEMIDKVPMDKKTPLASTTVKAFEKALQLSSKLALDKLNYKINKELTSFRASCELKRITIQE